VPFASGVARLRPELQHNSYASHILLDIQNYHEQHQAAPATPSFSLPACVAKACSILEAVADLNSPSSSSDNNHAYDYAPGRSSADDKGSVTAAPSGADNNRAAVRRVRDACAVEQAEPQGATGVGRPGSPRRRSPGPDVERWRRGSRPGRQQPRRAEPDEPPAAAEQAEAGAAGAHRPVASRVWQR
jgi:hypothetical protein